MRSFWFLLDFVILHERARGESEIPATALDVFTVKADPAWDDLMLRSDSLAEIDVFDPYC